MKIFLEKIFSHGLYLLLLTPLVFFQQLINPLVTSKIFFFETGVEILLALYLWLAIFYQEYRPRWHWLNGALLLFLIALALSAIFGGNWNDSFWSYPQRGTGIFLWLHLAAFFLMLSQARLNWVNYFSFAALLSALVALFPYLHLIYPDLFFDELRNRLSGTTGNAIYLAGYLLIHVFLGAWLVSHYFREKRWALIGLFGAIILLDLLTLFYTQTRGALLGLAVAVLYLAYWAYQSYKSYRPYLIIGLALLLLFAGFFALTRNTYSFWQGLPLLSRFTGSNLNLGPRLYAWNVARQAFLEKPILGWGWENFHQAFNKYYPPEIMRYSIAETLFDRPHNVFLEFLATTGLLGLAAYLWLIYLVFRRLPGPWLKALWLGYLGQNFFAFDTINNLPIVFALMAFAAQPPPQAVGSIGPIRPIGRPIGPIGLIGLIVLIVLAALPIYFINLPYLVGSYYHYWTLNYFLNQLPDEGTFYFHKTLAVPSIHLDFSRKDLAEALVQLWDKGIVTNKADVELAVAELQKAAANNPGIFQLHLALADLPNQGLNFDQKYLAIAQEAADRAKAISPKRQAIYYVIAKLKLTMGDRAGAVAAMKEAVALDPEVGDAHLYYGLLLFAANDPQGGSAEIKKAEALGRSPTPDEARVLGGYWADLAGDYQQAIKYFRLTLEYQPKNYEVRAKLGLAYYFVGNKELARRYLLEVQQVADFKKSPQYQELQPILQDLGLE